MIRVLRLEPDFRKAHSIAQLDPLGDDVLVAQPAGVFEDARILAAKVLDELDSDRAPNDLEEMLLALDQRQGMEIGAVELADRRLVDRQSD